MKPLRNDTCRWETLGISQVKSIPQIEILSAPHPVLRLLGKTRIVEPVHQEKSMPLLNGVPVLGRCIHRAVNTLALIVP